RPVKHPAVADGGGGGTRGRGGARKGALAVKRAPSHDTTSLEHQLKLRTENGRTAHAAVEWMASAIAERAARSPARSPGRGLLPVYSVAVLLAAARPDEVEGLAVVDEVGVDRSGEARIVQLDREVVAALAGALRPGAPDLGAADIDPMAGGVFAGPVGLGDDADALGLNAQGDDLALVLVAGLLEGADACHVTSP